MKVQVFLWGGWVGGAVPLSSSDAFQSGVLTTIV
jgi:hypothetical protein